MPIYSCLVGLSIRFKFRDSRENKTRNPFFSLSLVSFPVNMVIFHSYASTQRTHHMSSSWLKPRDASIRMFWAHGRIYMQGRSLGETALKNGSPCYVQQNPKLVQVGLPWFAMVYHGLPWFTYMFI